MGWKKQMKNNTVICQKKILWIKWSSHNFKQAGIKKELEVFESGKGDSLENPYYKKRIIKLYDLFECVDCGFGKKQLDQESIIREDYR